MTKTVTHTIDAKGKKLGRVATQIAVFLMGKDSPDFQRHLLADTKVEVVNASLMDITAKKRDEKEYARFSGYPGGRKVESMNQLIARKGHDEILRNAVYNMLANTRLRKPMLKNLTITN